MYPRKTEERWWKPIKTPSIHVSRKILYCHLMDDAIDDEGDDRIDYEEDEEEDDDVII